MAKSKCKKCGLVIANKKNHKLWHRSLKHLQGPPGPQGPAGPMGMAGRDAPISDVTKQYVEGNI